MFQNIEIFNICLLIHICVWLIHNLNYQVQFGINISEIDVSSMKWSMSLGSQNNISLALVNIYALSFGSLALLCWFNMPWKDGWDGQLNHPGERASSLQDTSYVLLNALPQQQLEAALAEQWLWCSQSVTWLSTIQSISCPGQRSSTQIIAVHLSSSIRTEDAHIKSIRSI